MHEDLDMGGGKMSKGVSSVFFILKYFSFMCLGVCLHMHLCITWVPGPEECLFQIPWGWNYRQLWANLWVLGIEPESS